MPDDIYYGDMPEQVTPDTTAPDDGAASFWRRIIAVQRKLKAPKNNFNAFGKYAYRNCEDILEGLKPLLAENDLLMTMCDELVFLEGRFYIKATVTVRDAMSALSHSVSAYAREPENKKGSDQSQVTGSCSSYARKYALSALWLIDDNKDPDEGQKQEQPPKEPPAQGPFVASCTTCGTSYQFQSVEQYRQFLASPACCANPHWVVM